jgi:Putative zincin peptidase
MFIPGPVIALLTFPGVIVHEIAHQLFCRIFRVAVLDVCYFRFGNPAGYVIHEPPPKAAQQILIGIGPFFVNSILGALIALPAVIPVMRFDAGSPLDYLLMWLGVSIAMHAFPSTGDAKSIWSAVQSGKIAGPARLAAMPVVGLIYLCAAGSMFWLDLIYGMALAMLFPNLLVALLA